MITASIRGEIQAVQTLLEEDVELVNARGAHSCTPLYVVVRDAMVPNSDFLTEMLGDVPAQKNRMSMVRLLLDHGASPDLKVHGSTPLYYAVQQGDSEVS